MAVTKQLINDALEGKFLSAKQGLYLYERLPLGTLMSIGHALRKKLNPGNQVTWIIDRNVNITNVCMSGCLFCNFYRTNKSPEAYITTMASYCRKIEEMIQLGGNQLLLQGGMHPDLGLAFYKDLFRDLKNRYPSLRLHALGPPEIVHLAKLEKTDYHHILTALTESGLDSLPGAGAEILVDRVRNKISPAKCSAREWLDVMREAHKLDLTTSATMMFGHVETPLERMQHLEAIRKVQDEKPKGHKGFLNFIPWPFQDEGTRLQQKQGIQNRTTAEDYLRLIAISRIMLPNIRHIQASWLTVGKETGQLSLHAGADDFGSIMIEEKVVSVAGASHRFDAQGIQEAISEAGFNPAQRNQDFDLITMA
jgi:cyclic dehypoxanthinyl futalosine synthase